MSNVQRSIVTVSAAAVLLAALTGCSASSLGGAMSGSEYIRDDAAVDSGGAMSAYDANGAPIADRAVVVTGSIQITVDNPIAAAESATRTVTQAGGRIDARTEYAADDHSGGSATLRLRIPADKLDAVRAELATLGTVTSTNTDSRDVSDQQSDLETRITTLRATIARYTTWLATAEKTSDLIELESAIAERQTELERLLAQQTSLTDQVALSTIELNLYAPDTSPADSRPTDFVSGLGAGWDAFVAFWGGVLVVIGVLVPWLVLVGVGLLALVLVLRWRRSRRPSVPQVAPAAPADAAPAAQHEVTE